MNLKEHIPSDACPPWTHCWIHNVDEPDSKYCCLECQHAWPSEMEFLWDHNWDMMSFELDGLMTNDVEQIAWCPLCGHSF